MKLATNHSKLFKWSFVIALTWSLVGFISNWLMQLHQGQLLSVYQLFDISFFYFVPIISWMLLTVLVAYFFDFRLVEKVKKHFVYSILLLIAFSFLVRVADILIDFSFKRLFGMIETMPWEVLNDVWLVVISTTPLTFFKLVAIAVLVYYWNVRNTVSDQLSIKTIDGSFYLLDASEILYVQSSGNYLNIKAGEQTHKVRSTLKQFASQLNCSFIRIHRSTIIHKGHVKSLKHWRNGEYLLIMSNNKSLTSSKGFKDQIDDLKKERESQSSLSIDHKAKTIRPSVAILEH